MNRHERRQAKKLRITGGASPRIGGSDDLKRLALAHLQSGRWDDAEALYKKAWAIDPSDPDVLHFLGIIAYRTGRYDLATTRLTEATRVAPGYAEVHNNLGILLLEQQKFDQAITRFRRAVSLKPNYAAAYANLGNALRKSGSPKDATASYRRAIQLNPRHKEAHYWLAAALLSQGDLAAVIRICDDCLELDPLCQHALAYQAVAQYGLNKEAEAKSLVDFATMVVKAQIRAPSLFDDIEAFNEALIADIRAHPSLIWEPADRVTRGGSVTKDLLDSPTATIKSLEKALRVAIDEFRNSLPAESNHPFFGTTPEAYRLTLIASILKAGGHHPSHIHEGAWLSGVYYVNVPKVISDGDEGHAGWLEFGRPDCEIPAGCELKVSAVVPESGAVVMFPSYFFHHTIPYQDVGERIGVAFDAYRVR
jgi:uncharacterized protein (TIGR02466 family)